MSFCVQNENRINRTTTRPVLLCRVAPKRYTYQLQCLDLGGLFVGELTDDRVVVVLWVVRWCILVPTTTFVGLLFRGRIPHGFVHHGLDPLRLLDKGFQAAGGESVRRCVVGRRIFRVVGGVVVIVIELHRHCTWLGC